MSGTLPLLRANPGLAIAGGLLVALAGVLGLLTFLLLRSGASLRPVVFLAGFLGIVAVPPFAFHLSRALGWIPRHDLTWVPGRGAAPAVAPRYGVDAARAAIREGRFADARALFGSGHDPSLVVDLRTRAPGGPFAEALAAEMASLSDGTTLLVARYRSAAEAERAGEAVAGLMLGAVPAPGPDGTRTVARAHDVAKLLVAGDAVVMGSAADAAAVERLFAAAPLVTRGATAAGAATADAAAPTFWWYRGSPLVALTLLLVVAAALWFFRMAPWASETPAGAGVAPVDAAVLRERLLAVNALDVPFRVEPSADDPSVVVVTWRYADARWLDLQRARGLRRTHRILMRLDGRDHTVRPTEQVSLVDWSVGRGGAGVRWATMRGIVFFQREHERVAGVQFGPDGRPAPNLSYAYTFDLQDLRTPFVQAVTAAGWRWRPTLVHGPAWLSWLTD